MRELLPTIFGLLLLAAVVVIPVLIVVHQYNECRAADFSVIYCTFTHVFR